MTNKEIAKWCDTTAQTLSNWKKSQKENIPFSKNNIYKSVKIGYYLLESKSDNMKNLEPNLTKINSTLRNLDLYSDIIEKECLNSKYIKEFKKEVLKLKEIINGLNEAVKVG